MSAVPIVHPRAYSPADAHAMLRASLGSWVLDLGLVVEECRADGARLRLPHSPRFARLGGNVSGQALMACADTAMGVAITSAFGEFRDITTVGQAMSFMRPIGAADTLIDAVVRKLGRNLVFAEAWFRAAGSEVACAHATATWAVLPADTR
jgi:acyl-coenzyme A thioesterase PaaI-like protein